MAGKLTVNEIVLGDSSTPTNNFLLKTNQNGTATLARNADGSGGNILTVASDGKVTLTNGETITVSKLQSGTAVASTSGTSIDFTGIPSWAKRITVMFDGISINGTTPICIQLGDSGGVETTGYTATGSAIQGTSVGATGTTANIPLSNNDGGAGWVRRGQAILNKLTGNTWTISSTLSVTGAASDRTEFGAGSKTLSDILTTVRIAPFNGTSSFTAGTINIMWE